MSRTIATLLVVLSAVAAHAQSVTDADPADETPARVAELVAQLDADTADERRAAEKTLVDLAGQRVSHAERVLSLLPRPNRQMPPAVRSGLTRVRREIEQRLAATATDATRVTLAAVATPLEEVIASISDQTGNKIRDDRANFGEAQDSKSVTLTVDDEPFWPTMDRLLDAAGLDIYPYGGRGEMALVARNQGSADRFGAAAYSGPFRFEPLRVVCTRGLRNTSNASLEVDVEVAWEPRLQPIALSQSLAEFRAVSEAGVTLSPLRPEQGIDVEVAPGSQTVEMTVALVLPSRDTRRIESITGTLRTLAPGRVAEFRFDRLGPSRPREVAERGSATVTFERFIKNNAIWELHMRLKLAGAGDALASHRGWVFQNPSYLVNAQGRRFEHAGFETTLQTEEEVGLAYIFDFTDEETGDEGAFNPQELTWVYETPVGVFNLPVEYELGPIDLP